MAGRVSRPDGRSPSEGGATRTTETAHSEDRHILDHRILPCLPDRQQHFRVRLVRCLPQRRVRPCPCSACQSGQVHHPGTGRHVIRRHGHQSVRVQSAAERHQQLPVCRCRPEGLRDPAQRIPPLLPLHRGQGYGRAEHLQESGFHPEDEHPDGHDPRRTQRRIHSAPHRSRCRLSQKSSAGSQGGPYLIQPEYIIR